MASFDIPEKYAEQLEPIEVTDTRSDDEILASLNEHAPVTSEKNIWAFWHDGLTKAPAWCQRNTVDWVRICGGTGWTIRVLDNVPDSPNYALRYVSQENVPECFIARTMNGPYVGQHSADFVRGAAIFEHGGAWMDVGSIMTRHMDRICWDAICDPESPYKVATVYQGGQWIFNYFVAARKGDPFIRHWHNLFLHLWKGRDNHDGITTSPLFHYYMVMMAKEQQEKQLKEQQAKKEKEEQEERQKEEPQEGKVEGDEKNDELKVTGEKAVLDWKIGLRELMDYVSQIAAWHRVASLEDAGDGFSGVDYWTKHMLLLDFLEETCKPMRLLGKAEQSPARTLALLSMQRQRPERTEESGEDTISDKDYADAEAAVWGTLATSSFCKITHAKGLTHTKQLGSLLDEEANAGKDRAPGSFMELLRYGTVHFRQKRETLVVREAARPQETLKTGLLDP